MILSKDQIKIVKSIALYAIGLIGFLPLFRYLFGKPFDLGDTLISVAGILAGGLIIGIILIIGSSSPSKKDK